MGLAKCPNGHIYNPRRYGKICPYCNMKTQDEAFAGKNRWDLSLRGNTGGDGASCVRLDHLH